MRVKIVVIAANPNKNRTIVNDSSTVLVESIPSPKRLWLIKIFRSRRKLNTFFQK